MTMMFVLLAVAALCSFLIVRMRDWRRRDRRVARKDRHSQNAAAWNELLTRRSSTVASSDAVSAGRNDG